MDWHKKEDKARPRKNNRNRTDKIWLNKRSRMLMATAMIMNGG